MSAPQGYTFRCPACDTPNFLSNVRFARAQDDPLHCWKCEEFVDHAKLRLDPVRENRHQALMGRQVEVMAAGILYRGTFVEMTDEDVKLRGPTGWIILAIDRVSSVKEAGAAKAPFPEGAKSVDPGFYDPENE